MVLKGGWRNLEVNALTVLVGFGRTWHITLERAFGCELLTVPSFVIRQGIINVLKQILESRLLVIYYPHGNHTLLHQGYPI